ncbi:predicted protein [Sclerotinia sclerotiorum 1980 UF-70]|uniref:Uncharacterized protein n=1 Tax=Sclerotinia sclerotiorum (strain ATCC 18683 / 1980 / Ss-1) TaxID=665079 RepID=A7EWJ1_SCLS1|nr:predicted protein [Sclerotinia sclerotiorum 1980 UF-70]EDN93833.1 predicted protein [Sclerotinia sclerotiorum 1980 UF-70]
MAWGVDGEEGGGSANGDRNAGWEGAWGLKERDSVGGFSLGREWGMRDIGIVVGCYTAVLVLFLGVAVV